MKKSLRKLNLSRETLRALESPVLRRVTGDAEAGIGTLVPSCDTYCDLTWRCTIDGAC